MYVCLYIHGCRWETCYIFGYCGLVGNPLPFCFCLTDQLFFVAPLPTSTKYIYIYCFLCVSGRSSQISWSGDTSSSTRPSAVRRPWSAAGRKGRKTRVTPRASSGSPGRFLGEGIGFFWGENRGCGVAV